MSLIGDGAFDVAVISGLSSISEENMSMVNTYGGILPDHCSWYELLSWTFCNENFSLAPNCSEEIDFHDTVRLYKDAVLDDAICFVDSRKSVVF